MEEAEEMAELLEFGGKMEAEGINKLRNLNGTERNIFMCINHKLILAEDRKEVGRKSSQREMGK
jgi:hypothetical protein